MKLETAFSIATTSLANVKSLVTAAFVAQRLPVSYKRLDPRAKVPTYATSGAAGADFYACVSEEDAEHGMLLHPGETKRFGTGIAMHIANVNWALTLLPRSGLGSKGIILANSVGLIDSDYQGELGIFLYNRSKDIFVVRQGDRIAQGCFVPVIQAGFTEVQEFTQETVRGVGGFGSTGGTSI